MTTTTTGTTTLAAPLRLTLVIGSSRQGRFAPTVADWFHTQATARPDLTVDVLDVGELDLPHTFGAPSPEPPKPGPRWPARTRSSS